MTSSSAKSAKNRRNAVLTLVGAISVFVVLVACLTLNGSQFFRSVQPETQTVALIDLARQHMLKREYKQAEERYIEAIRGARTAADAEATAYAMATYAEFLRKRKRSGEAIAYEDNARRLQGIIK